MRQNELPAEALHAVVLRLAGEPGMVSAAGEPVPLYQRDAALLAWLAIEGPTARARLAALLWPDSALDGARNALRQRMFQLRKLAGADVVVGSTTLALAGGVTHDLQDADSVLGVRRDEIGGEFGHWLAQQREQRRARIVRGLVELGNMAEGARDYADALTHAQELLALDPLSEEAHRRVIRLHYLAGDRAAALLAFDRCEQVLKDEVGTRPSPHTLALLQTLQSAHDAPLAAADGPVPASVLRPPRMIGRDAELAAFDAGWRSAHVVALIGEAGLGKTRLLQAFVDQHAGVVRVAGRPGDAGVPFATLARLLRAVLAQATAPAALTLPPPARSEIARVLPEFDANTGPAVGEGQRLVMERAVSALLLSQATLAGVIVDDLHFADEASLEMLRALIDGEADAGVQAPRLRWALAYRPAEAGSAVQALQSSLVEEARLVPVPLRPLGEAALAELVDSLALPGVVGRALAPGLLQRTGGNPLYVLETLKQAWVDRTLSQFADARQLPKPLSVGRLIERRVAQLSPGALALARVASIAGVDFGIEMAEAVLGAPAMQFADALNELESAQVLRGTQFAHDLVFDAVRQSVPAPIAQHTHARVAAWLEAHDGEPARVAQHWIDAASTTRALPWLRKAADAAQRALRPKEYIAFMERKSAIEEAAGDRAAAFDSLLAAAETFVTSDREGAISMTHCDTLERLAATPAQKVEALVQRSHALRERGEPERALVPGQAALQHSLLLDDPALVARARADLALNCGMLDRGPEALLHLEACIGWFDAHAGGARRAEMHGAMAVIYDNVGRLEEALPHHRQCMALMREAGDLGNLSTACSNLACNRLDAGDVSAADAALQQGQQILVAFEEFGGSIGGLQVIRALALCHLGRYTAALAHAERGVDSMRRYQPGRLARAELRLAECWWHLGQWARVAGILGSRVPDAQASLPERVSHARLAWAYARESGAGPGVVAAARDTLAGVLAEIPDGVRPDLAMPLRLELAAEQGGAAALRELDAVRVAAERIGHLGTVLASRIRAAAVATDIDPQLACSEALAALGLARQGLQNTLLLPGELWLHGARALAAAGDAAQARQVLQRGADWVQDTARDHVPASFRDGFLQRNPVNREILALAARG